jgi:hypothetical protein
MTTCCDLWDGSMLAAQGLLTGAREEQPILDDQDDPCTYWTRSLRSRRNSVRISTDRSSRAPTVATNRPSPVAWDVSATS